MFEVLWDVVGEVSGLLERVEYPRGKRPNWKHGKSEARRDSTSDLVDALTETLDLLIERTGSVVLPENGSALNVFYDFTPVNAKMELDLPDFVRNVVQYFYCSEAAFLVALIYMDRLERCNPKLRVNQFNVRRLFLASVIIACKVLDDQVCRNSYYAQVSGIDLKTLNQMEAGILRELHYRTYVNPDDYYAITAE